MRPNSLDIRGSATRIGRARNAATSDSRHLDVSSPPPKTRASAFTVKRLNSPSRKGNEILRFTATVEVRISSDNPAPPFSMLYGVLLRRSAGLRLPAG